MLRIFVHAIAQILAVVLTTVGAFDSYLGTFDETCTQGAADSLVIAPIISIPAFALGFMLLVVMPLPRWWWLAMIPTLAGICYQFAWTAFFAYEFLIKGIAVCDLITGYGPFEPDGREGFFLVLWASMNVLSIGGAVCAIRRSFSETSRAAA